MVSANGDMIPHESLPAPRRRIESGGAEVCASPSYLTRKDLEDHLGVSEKAVDRLIREYGL